MHCKACTVSIGKETKNNPQDVSREFDLIGWLTVLFSMAIFLVMTRAELEPLISTL